MLRNSASINALIRNLTALLFFLTPVIFTTITKESYEFPKMFFVYFLGSTILLIYLLEVVWIKKAPLHLPFPILIILLANLIATIFSSHIYTSVWGYYSRFNGGLVSTIIYTGIFVLLVNTLTYAQREDIFLGVTVGCGIVALYTIFQYFDQIPLEAEFRAYGTIGQPNWAASYFGMIVPICIYNYLKSPRRMALLWLCLFGTIFFALWLTFSISGILGFIFSTATLFFLQKPYPVHKKKLLLLIPVIVLPYLVAPGIFAQKINAVIKDLSHFNIVDTVVAQQNDYTTKNTAISDPGAIRLNLWKDSLGIIVKNPKALLIGTGPETFPYAFQPHRSSALNYTSEWDFIFNKPHNYYIEILTELGIVGLLAYLTLYTYLLLKLPRWLTPTLIAFLVTNFFGWPSVSTDLLFILLASFGFKGIHAES